MKVEDDKVSHVKARERNKQHCHYKSLTEIPMEFDIQSPKNSSYKID